MRQNPPARAVDRPQQTERPAKKLHQYPGFVGATADGYERSRGGRAGVVQVCFLSLNSVEPRLMDQLNQEDSSDKGAPSSHVEDALGADDVKYIWEHWQFNAEQRIKAFNLFVTLSVFANGGIFIAIDKNLPEGVLLLIALFVIVLALVFWMMDRRSQILLGLSVAPMKLFEKTLHPSARLFLIDEASGANRGLKPRYTVAFRTLHVTQAIIGFMLLVYAAYSLARKC